MPILDDKGRPRSVRSEDEEELLLLDQISKMPVEERDALMEVYDKLTQGRRAEYKSLAEAEYARQPADIRSFLTDPYFLGETGGSLWPRLKDDMVELFEGDYHEAVLAGSIGWGKSFFATCAMAYVLYQISCLRSPQKAYGIDAGSYIYIAMLSVTEKVARRVAVNEMIGKLEHSRYFKEHFPLQAAPSQLEMRFPQQVQIVAGSTGSSAIIGLNVFSGFIDETSFMGAVKETDRHGKFVASDTGEKLYNSIIRRMKSRFQRAGRLPGVLVTVSSKERPNAFIEKRVKSARETGDPHVFVREYATWDVRPAEFFSPEVFKVVAGTDRVQSRILGDDPREEQKYRDMGLLVIDVPIDYRRDFEQDIDSALRDIAGVATETVSPYIQRTDTIFKAMENPPPSPVVDDGGTVLDEWVPGTPLPIQWPKVAVQYERRLAGGYQEVAWRPLRHPNAIRYVHIDASLTGDATGLAIAHIAQWTEVVRRDAAGEEYVELAPLIESDLLLRIIPPPGDEILLSDVRAIVYQFIDHGYQVGFASLDQYQSADTLQQFRKRGIEADLLSLDRTTEPYDVLKTALYEERVRLQQHAMLGAELRNLQRVPTGQGRVKIDHPKLMTAPNGSQVRGSKDLADALGGVVYSLTQRTPGRPIPILSGRSEIAGQTAEKPDHTWVTGGGMMVTGADGPGPGAPRGGMVKPGSGSGGGVPPLPFMKG